MSLWSYRNTLRFINFALLLFCIVNTVKPQTNANGPEEHSANETATSMGEVGDGQGFDFAEVARTCNASYTIPVDYIRQFNETAELPNTETEKTGMCFLRCYMEKAGFIRDWQLNRALIRQTMWPATGDSIPVCEKEGINETCACKRTYAIAKCLMIRAIVDAPSKPIV